jgi:hypothetical protein
MTITELAPEATTSESKSFLHKKVTGKHALIATIGAVVAGALCGFTYTGLSDSADANVISDVRSIALKVDTWAANRASETTKISLSSNATTNDSAFAGITNDPALKDVVWSVQGTTDAYCVKAYSKNGGNFTGHSVLTYDSAGGGLGSTGGACAPTGAAPVVGQVEIVEPAVGGSAGKKVESPVGVASPEDNTDIR